MNFKDKVVIVTGASSGIGAAVAIQFAAEGAKLALVGRNLDKLRTTSIRCKEKGSETLIITADITKDEDTRKIITETIACFGELHILINNAGKIAYSSILDENALEVFDDIIATNLRSAFYLTHLAASHLIKTKGNIINISSAAALGILGTGIAAYNTSKAGLDHFTRSVALELADKGVRVNAVNPGPVKTDIFTNMGTDKEYQERVFEVAVKGTALGRVSTSDDIANIVLFLASDKAASITGSSYVVDNGQLLLGVTKYDTV